MKLRKIITLLLSAVAVVTLAGLFNVSNAASGDKWFNIHTKLTEKQFGDYMSHQHRLIRQKMKDKQYSVCIEV